MRRLVSEGDERQDDCDDDALQCTECQETDRRMPTRTPSLGSAEFVQTLPAWTIAARTAFGRSPRIGANNNIVAKAASLVSDQRRGQCPKSGAWVGRRRTGGAAAIAGARYSLPILA